MDSSVKPAEPIEAKLGLHDAVSIIVGIIIGVGIFETPQDVFSQVPHPAVAIGVWVLGGLLALIGALCFAELAGAYPRSGGAYIYLTRAFGPLTGYLFAWSELTVTRAGSIAALAYIFGARTARLFGCDEGYTFLLAGSAVLGLTSINVIGVRLGTRTQNVLTIAKVLGLTILVVIGFGWGSEQAAHASTRESGGIGWFAGAMIFVLWTYAGWHEAAYIVSEAKNRTRNIPLALILGTTIVTVIYVLVNLAYLYGLGFAGAGDKNAAENLVRLAWPAHGARLMDTLVMVSSLGAINGMIFTTARICTEFSKDHRVFKVLSHWSKRLKTPVRALIIQGAICLIIITGVWWVKGDKDTFDATVTLTAAVFWTFFCLTGISVFILRAKDPDVPRPFRVPGYPVVPLAFCALCAYMVVGSVIFDPIRSLVGLGILFVGLPFYFIPQKLRQKQPEQELQQLSR